MQIRIRPSRRLAVVQAAAVLVGALAWWQVAPVTLVLVYGLLCAVALLGMRIASPRSMRWRWTGLILLGHADAVLEWQASHGLPVRWAGPKGGRFSKGRRLPGPPNHREPVVDVELPQRRDDVCIVHIRQWGGVCLWLTVAARFPERPPRRRHLLLCADALDAATFRMLCSRCRALQRGAGFLGRR